MVKSEGLEAVLVRAESALAGALIGSVDADATWTETKRLLDKILAYCRRLSADLAELSHSESTTDLGNARFHCRELRAVFLELNRSASIPFHCLDSSCSFLGSPRSTCWLGEFHAVIEALRDLGTVSNDPIPIFPAELGQAKARLDDGFSTQQLLSVDAQPGPSLLRQTIDLFVLVLAYLAYFFVDVQLQIASLPVPISWLKVFE